MTRYLLVTLGAAVTAAGLTLSAMAFRPATPPEVTREVIAVYVGTVGTDQQSGMISAVRDMKSALARQATATGRRFVSRGVSIEPSVEAGLAHLNLLGSFEEVSVGGNWTNSAVVRYLGPDFSDTSKAVIPQVILLERHVAVVDAMLDVGPEREIGRYIGTSAISAWVRRGAPLP
jgi:hypothetical protein